MAKVVATATVRALNRKLIPTRAALVLVNRLFWNFFFLYSFLFIFI